MVGIYKAYDIRGLYEKQITIKTAYDLGYAYAKLHKPKNVVIGHDVRHGSKELANALIDGLIDCGVNVTFMGLSTTPSLYFVVNQLKADGGINVTASHNPKEYVGFKLVKEKGIPISMGFGLEDIEKYVSNIKTYRKAKKQGKVNLYDPYEQYIKFLVDRTQYIQPLRIVVDTSNGAMGDLIGRVLENFNVHVILMNETPDGDFPGHEPNPLLAHAQKAVQNKVKSTASDFGVIFDGDGDRIVFVDNQGVVCKPDIIGAAISKYLLSKISKASVVYCAGESKSLVDAIEQNGGKAIRTKVGYVSVRHTMRKNKSIFGAEASGHYFYDTFYYCDNALITLLTVLELVSEQTIPLADILNGVRMYALGDSINLEVANSKATIKKVKTAYKNAPITNTVDEFGAEYDDWWFNIRSSNTEPVVRVRIEAIDEITLKAKTKELLALLKA